MTCPAIRVSAICNLRQLCVTGCWLLLEQLRPGALPLSQCRWENAHWLLITTKRCHIIFTRDDKSRCSLHVTIFCNYIFMKLKLQLAVIAGHKLLPHLLTILTPVIETAASTHSAIVFYSPWSAVTQPCKLQGPDPKCSYLGVSPIDISAYYFQERVCRMAA